jgi:hypothetical protein
MNALKTTAVLVAALCSAYGTAASAGDTDPVFVTTSQLTRAEVLADLEVWQLAGMPNFARGDTDIDPSSVEYMAAQAKYQQLAHSPDFTQRVMRIARQRGERVDVAANESD